MKCNFKAFGQASDEIILEFENHIGFVLPNDYKEFLRKYNGGHIYTQEYGDFVYDHPERGYWCFWVKELNDYVQMDFLYGLNLKEYDINKVNNSYGDDLLDKTIYIAHSRSSGYILLGCGEYSGIYYYEIASIFEPPDENINTYKIADTFTEFINGLVEVPIDQD